MHRLGGYELAPGEAEGRVVLFRHGECGVSGQAPRPRRGGGRGVVGWRWSCSGRLCSGVDDDVAYVDFLAVVVDENAADGHELGVAVELVVERGHAAVPAVLQAGRCLGDERLGYRGEESGLDLVGLTVVVPAGAVAAEAAEAAEYCKRRR